MVKMRNWDRPSKEHVSQLSNIETCLNTKHLTFDYNHTKISRILFISKICYHYRGRNWLRLVNLVELALRDRPKLYLPYLDKYAVCASILLLLGLFTI